MLFESQFHQLHQMLPWVAIRNAKRALRNIDEQKRRILTSEKVHLESQEVIKRIESMHHFQVAKTVMVYFPVNNEIDLRPLVQKYEGEKTFLFPALTHRTHRMAVRIFEPHTPFTKGCYGIPQPDTDAYRGSIDLILVPGISFDKRRWRVGRGGGYYDRFIRRYAETYTVGVCYDFQVHNKVPHWLGDRRVNRVVTPTQTI